MRRPRIDKNVSAGLLKTRRVFSGKLLKLSLQRHRFPNNYVGDLEVIGHPGAVLIVPFLSNNKIILIRQYRPVLGAFLLELPAGTLKKGEDPNKCAQREMAEEIGYKATKIEKLGFIYPSPGYTTEKIFIYKATGLRKVEQQKEDDELIYTKVLTRRQLLDLARKARITDSKTLCALSMAGII